MKGLSRFRMLATAMKSLIENVVTMVATRMAEQRITLCISPIDTALTTECHPQEIRQVLYNLLVNAMDSASGLPAAWVRIDVADDGDRILVRVSDCGRGIPGHLEARIWQPFFTTKGTARCPGLGLGISRGIVERHGGELFLDKSHPHTCFTMTLAKATPQRRVS